MTPWEQATARAEAAEADAARWWDVSDQLAAGGLDGWDVEAVANPPDPCAEPYKRWRSGTVPTFQEVKDEMMRESREYAAAGDYSKPADRRAVLGRMHQYKQAAWQQHEHDCDEAAEAGWVWDSEAGEYVDAFDNPPRPIWPVVVGAVAAGVVLWWFAGPA